MVVFCDIAFTYHTSHSSHLNRPKQSTNAGHTYSCAVGRRVGGMDGGQKNERRPASEPDGRRRRRRSGGGLLREAERRRGPTADHRVSERRCHCHRHRFPSVCSLDKFGMEEKSRSAIRRVRRAASVGRWLSEFATSSSSTYHHRGTPCGK